MARPSIALDRAWTVASLACCGLGDRRSASIFSVPSREAMRGRFRMVGHLSGHARLSAPLAGQPGGDSSSDRSDLPASEHLRCGLRNSDGPPRKALIWHPGV